MDLQRVLDTAKNFFTPDIEDEGKMPIPFMDVPQGSAQVKAMCDANDEIVAQIEETDRMIMRMKYIPDPEGKHMTHLKQQKRKLIARHILCVLAINGNPHLKAKNTEERNMIVKDIMAKRS